MMNTPQKGLGKSFFPVLITVLVILSIFTPGIVLSEETENKIEILIHKRDKNFENLPVRQRHSVIEDYDEFVLVETTEENKLALERKGYVVESLENKNHVGLQSHSFDTDEGLPEIPESLKIESNTEEENGIYIIQFIGPIKTEWKEELKEMGVVLHEFRHRFNFIVEMDPETKDEIEDLDFVNWVGIYQPAYKFNQELLEKTGPIYIEASIFDGYRSERLRADFTEIFGPEFSLGRNRITGQVEVDKIEILANLPRVKSISEKTQEYHLYNSDATWIGETNEKDYRKLTEEGITGKGELITVMDSELYMEDGYKGDGVHEMWEDPDNNSIGDDHRKVQAWYVPGDSNAKLEYGTYHGTHVTGTVLGGSPPYSEYNNHDGHALDARVIFQDIDNEVWGLNPPSDMYNMGWGDSYEKDSRIHTNSWGGGDGYGGLGLEADEFLWDHKDFNILFAMANSGPDPNTLSQQAEGKNVISVGSVTNHPNQDDISSFSSRGYADDGRIKPTIMHVGEGVFSANRSYDGYQSMSGTSMSTPGIAGQIGQIRQYYEEGWYPSGIPISEEGFEPSNALVRATLINGAVEITGDGAYYNEAIFPNNDQGYGRSKLDRVLHIQGDERELKVFDSWDEGVELETGESWSMKFDIEDPSQELEVTLAWTDHPGSSGSDEDDPAIVNDLDLKLNTPDGTRYVGNAFTGYNPGYSEPDPTDNTWSGLRDGEYDGLNVEENILLLPDYNGVEKGTYELTVSGHNIPEGPQPFAVVITGGLDSSDTNDPPSIELTRPTGGETWQAGEEEDLLWETTSGDGTIEGIDLEYSNDSGDTWSYIEQDLQDTGSYTWVVPKHSTEEAKVRAVVHDENGLSDQDVSGSFTIEVLSGPFSPTNPQPKDNSLGIITDPEISVDVEHEEGDPMDVNFYDASDDSLIAELNEVPSGTRVSTVWSGLDHGSTYEWYAEAVDGEYSNVSESWKFTTVQEHSLTINIAGEGSTYPNEGTHTYKHEEEVTVTANSEEHWYFDEWKGDASGTEEEITIIMDEDKEITAVFEEYTYILDIKVEGNGSVEIDPDKEEYAPNTDVNLIADSEEDWEFVEWIGDYGGSEAEITVTMDENKLVTAVFEEVEETPEEYNLTIKIEGEGTTDPEEGTHAYEEGTKVTLAVVAQKGWYFSHWIGVDSEVEEDEIISVTLEEDREIVAHFERKEIEEYTLKIDIIGEGSAKIDGEEVTLPHTEKHEKGTEVTIEAVAEENWSFVEWLGDYESDEKKITISIEDDIDIMIHLEKFESAQFEVEILSYDVESKNDEEILLLVEYSLENTGDVEDTQKIMLYVEGEKKESTEITLEPKEERIEEFIIEVEEGEFCEIKIVCEDDNGSDTVMIESNLTEPDSEENNIPSFTFLLLLLGIVFSILFTMKGKYRF